MCNVKNDSIPKVACGLSVAAYSFDEIFCDSKNFTKSYLLTYYSLNAYVTPCLISNV